MKVTDHPRALRSELLFADGELLLEDRTAAIEYQCDDEKVGDLRRVRRIVKGNGNGLTNSGRIDDVLRLRVSHHVNDRLAQRGGTAGGESAGQSGVGRGRSFHR